MFKRKLISLDYHDPTGFDHNNETEYRNLVVWLEDQKIRHYKIEDRAELRDAANAEWPAAFHKYLGELGSCLNPAEQTGVLDWLLGYAIRLEYGDNVDKFKNASALSQNAGVTKKSTNPIDNIDFNDPDFKAGVASLASLLQIPPHPDHLQLLKAVCILIKEKFSKEALDKLKAEGIKPAGSISTDKIPLGFETSDYITAEAARILRMLHIRELRDLQDGVNQAIVAVQGMTANPKTDTKLGKVGRS